MGEWGCQGGGKWGEWPRKVGRYLGRAGMTRGQQNHCHGRTLIAQCTQCMFDC